jgi:hypothetical protein
MELFKQWWPLEAGVEGEAGVGLDAPVGGVGFSKGSALAELVMSLCGTQYSSQERSKYSHSGW